MNQWLLGWTDGRANGRTDGWMDGWSDRGAYIYISEPKNERNYKINEMKWMC